ncbi:MAG: hypothetical protein ACE1ZE_07215, partial [Candidatus Binatia bacterium]
VIPRDGVCIGVRLLKGGTLTLGIYHLQARFLKNRIPQGGRCLPFSAPLGLCPAPAPPSPPMVVVLYL